jgi:hypothetical protein
MRPFFSNTVATDTIPLKLVVYLGLLAAILLLLIQAWHTAIPVLEDAQIKAQTEAASVSILSIQGGYTRNSADRYSPEGSMCTLKFSIPASIRYISFGVDPDSECNGRLNDSEWVLENNTIIYQYKNGVKNRLFLKGTAVHFAKGERNPEGVWIPLADQENNETFLASEETGVVIEDPISGEYLFEMVSRNGVRYTMSHF